MSDFALTFLLAAERGVIGVYSPLTIALSVAGVAVPFATGRFIDALAYQRSPHLPFIVLSSLLISRALLTPLLQRFICSRSRDIETRLQFRVLDSTMTMTPARLSGFPSGELVSKLSRDTYAVGGFVRGLSGANGVGKSTLLKLAVNALEPQCGEILVNGHPFREIDLAVARAGIRNPIVLILDEATNHLDAESRERIAKLANSPENGRLILIAGHDPELNELYDREISCQIPKSPSYISV